MNTFINVRIQLNVLNNATKLMQIKYAEVKTV